MDKRVCRLFSIDGDTVEVKIIFDNEIGSHIYDYPDFSNNPRITPNGRRWVNVFYDRCPYASKEYGDCGSCEFFRCEKQGDLIGICCNDNLTQEREKQYEKDIS